MAAISSRPALDIDLIRSQFPSLASGFAYLENAGGSQVPGVVAGSIRDYMLSSYVQLGAGYPASVKATEIVRRGHEFVNTMMNGEGIGQTILGPSSTQLLYMLSDCYSRYLKPGDEIILGETGHEANIGPWLRLKEKGIGIKWWEVQCDDFQCSFESLQGLLTPKTKLLCFPHVSNLLGEIVDVPAITKAAHANGTIVVVDGVAYAPHRAIDVRSWDVDWYVYSTYKVYGPHMGALYGKFERYEELEGPNHFFIPKSDPYKFELGGASHEGCAGLLGLGEYLQTLTGEGEFNRRTAERAFQIMTELELPVQKKLVEYLLTKPVRVIGPQHGEESRISTISFVHDSVPSPEIAAHVNKRNIGIRFGHMYAYRMCQRLGIDLATGVVRISAVHYNTVEEIDRLIEVLEEIL